MKIIAAVFLLTQVRHPEHPQHDNESKHD